MKRCPKCSRTFPDENQKFCTIDGGLLRTDPPAFDPNLTMRATSKDLTPIPEAPPSSEAPTSTRLTPLDETIASFGSSTFHESNTGPIGNSTADDLKPPAPGATTSAGLRMPSEVAPTSIDLRLPPGVAPTSAELTPPAPVATSANLPAAAAATPPAGTAIPPTPAKKKSMLPLVIGGVLLLLLVLGGGAAAAGYFLWLKPRMEANRRPEILVKETNENSNRSTVPANTNTNESTNTNTSTNTNSVTPREPEPFVPTTGAVQFANSKVTLDGKLLEHYVDFSFYYPRAWLKDPQAGVPGASNFARLSDSSDEYAGENVAVSWYESKGTFEADSAIFRDRAQALSDQFAKSLPNYQFVSQGETTVNNLKAYEFRFKGVFKGTPKGDLPYWGRVVFLPPGAAGEKTGVSIIMLATSLASGVSGVDDVGVKGGLPLILESFRFGPSK
jgi:hypothetical protein